MAVTIWLGVFVAINCYSNEFEQKLKLIIQITYYTIHNLVMLLDYYLKVMD
jgi:hypothetical protein